MAIALATMNPAQSRRLAIGLLIAVSVALVAAIAVPVWMLHRYYDGALAENTDKLERFRRVAGTRGELARQNESLRTKDIRRFFLRSGAAALSAAEATDVVKSLVEGSGGRLITMQAPATKDEGRYRQVSVNVQMTANIFALRRIFHAIETNTPYLFVDNLVVRSQVPGNFRPPPGGEPEMFVQFDVSGYALTGQ
jgi:general secretion pathway protein M